MRQDASNHYERAFENWLIDRGVKFVRAEDHRRLGPAGATVKSFDFLLRADNGKYVAAEVKGRTFRGTSLVGLKGLDCWVTLDDVEGLLLWQRALGENYVTVFIFAYRIVHVDVDLDGREVFCVGHDRYVFLAVRAEDYHRYMKRRSPRWRTVTLPAAEFRRYVVDPMDLLADPAIARRPLHTD